MVQIRALVTVADHLAQGRNRDFLPYLTGYFFSRGAGLTALRC
jgi:hypothetical protein